MLVYIVFYHNFFPFFFGGGGLCPLWHKSHLLGLSNNLIHHYSPYLVLLQVLKRFFFSTKVVFIMCNLPVVHYSSLENVFVCLGVFQVFKLIQIKTLPSSCSLLSTSPTVGSSLINGTVHTNLFVFIRMQDRIMMYMTLLLNNAGLVCQQKMV